MLIEFRVENHRSLRDEQALTMEAGRVGDDSDPRPRSVKGHAERILPAAAIYGANASGKSNVLSALGFMREAVLNSHRFWDPGGGIPRSPFGWGGKRKTPSLFETSLLIKGIKYQYGFVLDDEIVREEWLHAWPDTRKQVWFERDGENFKFGDNFKGSNGLLKEVTRSNALFLSVAAQHNHPLITFLYSWFRDVHALNVQGNDYGHFPSSPGRPRLASDGMTPATLWWYLSDESGDQAGRTSILQLLKIADTGIVDIKPVVRDGLDTQDQHNAIRLRLKHLEDDEESWLDLEQESQGTRALIDIAFPMFDTMERGGLLLVDELESSLHPLLSQAIIRMFNSPESNRKNAQILFSTHDTNLLGTTLGDPLLRRDQIWLTEKDREGATKLYPLTDYKPRKVENLERGYLQGRYGAVPFLGDLAPIAE